MFDSDMDFSSNSKEAKQRFEYYFKDDPFPDIQSALLNSADIYDYVRVTGMVWPFDPDPDKGKLKSASYEVDFLGTLHLVNSDSGRYEIRTINTGESYTLPKNSISFLFTDTVFHLPRYMAARFNLRIKLVHAGLLLGTGPLIDPGFAGRLLIPLHNLTSEDFIIHGGEGLIWVEFTKLSPIKEPDDYRKGRYHTFPEENRYTCALTYLRKASRTGLAVPASSSIPEAILTAKQNAETATKNADNARSSANEARDKAKEISERFKKLGVYGLIAVVITLAALFLDVHYFISNTNGEIRDQITPFLLQ